MPTLTLTYAIKSSEYSGYFILKTRIRMLS